MRLQVAVSQKVVIFIPLSVGNMEINCEDMDITYVCVQYEAVIWVDLAFMFCYHEISDFFRTLF
jgi:hypothetical protein